MELYTPPGALRLGHIPYQSPYEGSFIKVDEAFPGVNFCTWGIFEVVEGARDELLDQLHADGWEPWNDTNRELFFFLESHLGQTLIIGEKERLAWRYWARSSDIRFAANYPVFLTYQSAEKNPLDSISPQRVHGTCALIDGKASIRMFTIDQLGEEGARLLERIRTAMLIVPSKRSLLQEKVGKLADLRRSRWEQGHQAAQQLARMYWDLYQRELNSKQEVRNRPLPPITTAHRTRLPLNNAFEGLVQSFGPGMRQADWNWKHLSGTLEMTMPNDSRLFVEWKNDLERAALDRYVRKMLGPEGLKHLLVLLDVYALQTGGVDPEADASISPRQLLLRLGKGKKADTSVEQSKLMHTILYLSRTTIRSHEYADGTGARPQSFARQQGLPRKPKRYAPLLVLERVEFERDGSMHIPRQVEYRLDKEFFEALFGARPAFFAVPTAQLLEYHAVRNQHELALAFYLSNRLALSGGQFYVPFHSLLVQSSLQTRESVRHDHDRTRNVKRILDALEHLEQDDLIRRSPHEHIDTVLLAGLKAGTTAAKDLAPTTYVRIEKELQSSRTDDLDAKRLDCIRLLLDENVNAYPVQFSSGPLLSKQPTLREVARTSRML